MCVISSATDLDFVRYLLGRSTGFVRTNYARSWINHYFHCIRWVKKTSKFVFCRTANALDRKFWLVLMKNISAICKATFLGKFSVVYLGLKKEHVSVLSSAKYIKAHWNHFRNHMGLKKIEKVPVSTLKNEVFWTNFSLGPTSPILISALQRIRINNQIDCIPWVKLNVSWLPDY